MVLLGLPRAASARGLEVELNQGALRGASKSGVQSFLGIPYAAPPVGALRFRAPAAPERWSGMRDARAFAPVCPQTRIGAGAPAIAGDEDCLYLNVHAPDVDDADLPVMLWIHGGGRRVGDGRRDVSAFVRETRSIVVTIQYRLDHLAFLAHPALSAEDPARLTSANYGFQDAIAALRWVRDEIAVFGGDSQRVTIAGLSGGGTMVCGLLVSPHAAGLFQRAIVQSAGSCWFPTDPISLAEARGVALATKLGCDTGTNVPACLRAQPIEAFFRTGASVDNPFPAGSTEWFAAQPILGGRSGHVVDGYVFPRSWPQAFRAGAFHRVPLMIGVTEHEGRRIYGELLYQMGASPLDASDYPRALHGLLGSEALAAAAAAQYPLDATEGSAARQFADIATDVHYTCPHAEHAAATAPYTPTWLYRFRVAGPRHSDRIELGAYHGADTELLFGASSSGRKTQLAPAQQRAARTLRGYVARFMRTGDPNGDGAARWPAHDTELGSQHLDFDATPHAAGALRENACGFWRDSGWDALPGA